MIRRLLTGIAWLAVLAVLGFLVVLALTPGRPPPTAPPAPPQAAPPPPGAAAPAAGAGASGAPAATEPGPRLASGAPVDCTASRFDAAAARNAASLRALAWAPFHRPEVGWETYAPRIAREIGSACAADSPAFARALAAWQHANRLPATGELDPATFAAMQTRWELARPFVRLSRQGVCPDPPPPAELAWARPEEGYSGKPVQLRPAALSAYRRLVAAARAQSPQLAADPRLLTIFSGWRDPADDAARCRNEGNCANVSRALCSAHRTGLAVDLYLGSAPGKPPDTADDANRLYQSRTPAYAWLIDHAGDYGFINYPFEPWHWEWAGEAWAAPAGR